MSAEPDSSIGFASKNGTRSRIDLTGQPFDAAGVIYITDEGLFARDEAKVHEILATVSGRVAEQILNSDFTQLVNESLERFNPVIPFLEKTAANASISFSAEIHGLAGLFGSDATQVALHSAAVAVLGVLGKNEELEALIREKMDDKQRYAYIVFIKTAVRIRAFADALNGHFDFIDDYLVTAVPKWKEMTGRVEKEKVKTVEASDTN